MLSYRHLIITTALIAGLSLAGCATAPTTPVEKAEFETTNDPFEPTNRYIFSFNDFLDRLLIGPLAGLYRATVPPPIRDRVANILGNMSEPVIMANNMFQGEFTSAGTTLGRFLTNSTLGVGGMFEVANGLGLPEQQGDFGQTLHVWGFGSGPYLVLPLFGPSNIRDAIGLGIDTLISPWKYAVANAGGEARDIFDYSDMGASALAQREAVIEAYDSLREGSLDFYAQMRSVYRQHRAKQLGDTTAGDMPQFDDYESDATNRPIIQ